MAEQTPEQQWAPGWKRDPWQRFVGRYWDGARWTEDVVSQERIRTIDPPPTPPAERHDGPPEPEVEPARPPGRPVWDRFRAWPRWAQWSLCVATGLLVVGAAARGGGVDRRSVPPTTTAGAPATGASGPCQPADAQVRRLLEGLRGGAAALRNPNAVALDPPVGNLRFVVAAEIDGPGRLGDETQIGAWASVSADGSGLPFALDENARRYSIWGDAAIDGSPAGALRDEAARRPEVGTAKACVGAR